MLEDAANRKTLIIDRTLSEIRTTLLRMSRLDILDLCCMLMNVGADIIETDLELLGKMGKLPEGLVFMLKVCSLNDMEACVQHRIKRCVLHSSLLSEPGVVECIKTNGLFAELEVIVNSIEGVKRLEKLHSLKGMDSLSCLRLTGLGKLDAPDWIDEVEHIRTVLGKFVDICPDNRFSMGNAVALEAAANGIDFVTTSFTGFGNDCSYAALEIVLSALKLQRKVIGKADPEVLSVLCEQFTKCSRMKISKNKPVIGENIMPGRSGGHTVSLTITKELADA